MNYSTTRNIKIKYLALGGLLASVIIFLTNGFINTVFLGDDFAIWAKLMDGHINPPEQWVSTILWTLMCLVYGFLGVALYVGVRPRFGAGARTALLTGFSIWVTGKVTSALDMVALGMLPNQIIIGQLIGNFISIMIGIYFGALIYKE